MLRKKNHQTKTIILNYFYPIKAIELSSSLQVLLGTYAQVRNVGIFCSK